VPIFEKCHPKFTCAIARGGHAIDYLMFWQCAIVEAKVPMSKFVVLAMCHCRCKSASIEIICIDIVPNQINVPMLCFYHSAMCKSINRSAIARMKVPLAKFSDLKKCQSFCCK
jgi:hypothetical protein